MLPGRVAATRAIAAAAVVIGPILPACPSDCDCWASPRFETEAVSDDLPLGKPASLLYYLAVRGEWVSRTELSVLYRPDMAEAGALNYLRGLLFRAKPFAWAADLEVRPERLRWRVPNDVERFSACMAEGRWSDALELYRGRFLAGIQEAESSPLGSWVEVQRSALEAMGATRARRRACGSSS